MLLTFLKKNELNRLKVFATLFIASSVTFKDVQEITKSPPTTASRIITELNDDLGALTDQKAQIIMDDYSYYLHNTSSQSTSELFTMMYLHYLENSITFHIFFEIFTQPHTNILSLCSTINISQSYCYTKISEINQLIEEYHFRIKIDNHTVFIEGKEESILFFVFLIYKFLLRAMDQTFSEHRSIKYSNIIQNILSKYPLRKTEITTLTTIFSTADFRSAYVDNIKIENPNIREILLCVTENKNIFADISSNKHYSEDTMLFYNFFSRAFMFNIDDYQSRVLLGQSLYQLSNNDMITNLKTMMAQLLTQDFNDILEESNDLYNETFYLLCLYTCYIDIIGDDYKNNFQEFRRKQFFDFLLPESHTVETKLHRLVNESTPLYHNWTCEQKSSFTTLITELLYGSIFAQHQPKLRILIDLPGYLLTEHLIQKQILSYFSHTMISFVEEVEDADLIITDQITSLPLDIEQFYFFDFQSKELWNKLLLKITELGFQNQLLQNKRTLIDGESWLHKYS